MAESKKTPPPERLSETDLERLLRLRRQSEADAKAEAETAEKAQKSRAAYSAQVVLIGSEYDVDYAADEVLDTGEIQRGVVPKEEQDRRRVMARRSAPGQGPATHVGR